MSERGVGGAIDPRIVAAFERDNGFPIAPHLIVLGLVGSHSHGTYIPPTEPDAIDDVDMMGFLVPPLDYHLGLPRFEHWTWQFEELDVVVYGLEKAVRLLLKGNPNIVGLLWLREQEYLYRTSVFDRLIQRRDIFTSQQAAQAFSGYAYGQLKRMEAFDLDRMAEYEALADKIKVQGPLREVLEADDNKMRHIAHHWRLEMADLSRFRKMHRQHVSGYMGDKRKGMVRKYQYDVKNAAHLIRLLRMGAEFLRTGTLQVYRTTDADQLRQIKQGVWTLAEVRHEADALFRDFEAARLNSTLPPEPDGGAANALLVELHRTVLGLTPNISPPFSDGVSYPGAVALPPMPPFITACPRCTGDQRGAKCARPRIHPSGTTGPTSPDATMIRGISSGCADPAIANMTTSAVERG